MKRQRIIKLVVTVDSEKQDWGGYLAKHPSLGLVSTADTEIEALDKMEKLISRTLDYGLVHGYVKFVKLMPGGRGVMVAPPLTFNKPAKAGK